MKFYIILCGILLTFILTECDNSTAIETCTSLAEPAIEVEVINARTGEFIAKDARGIITDGSYKDSLRYAHITQTVPTLIVSSLTAGAERAGTYSINLHLAGYTPWSRENIKVLQGDCGPETVKLQARLKEVK